MAGNETAPDDFLQFVEEGRGAQLALVPLGETEIPRVGEWVCLPTQDSTALAAYHVTAIIYRYGSRGMGDRSTSMLGVTVTLQTRQKVRSSASSAGSPPGAVGSTKKTRLTK